MNQFAAASLGEALLVVKGAAAPSRGVSPRVRRAGREEDGRARVTMRLEEARHRRLRLAAAHLHKSAQAVLLAALDHYLERILPGVLHEPCPCLDRRGGPDPILPVSLRMP
jgi:hypothetical protein